ncbi:ABC-2 family transporter protein [Clostridium bornimense]|uniref:ABC transporter permease n=1 Tax=Clostridium bornimense TaxID=1216932 RepID=UPI001C128425|nr:ABC-2 family transporter protein [Clostridium bornimense]
MRLYLKYFSIQLRSIMEYKVSFLFTVIGQFFTTIFSFIAMYFLFDRFGNINGYGFNEVLLLFSTILISFSLGECFGRGFDRFSSIISNGEFDRIMLRPRSLVIQVLGSKIEFSRIGRLIQATVIFIYGIITSNVQWTIGKVITLILMVVGGVCIFSGLFIIYAGICFFTIEGLEIMNIFTDGGKEIAQYPLNIYEKWVMKFFTFVIPFAFVNYYPFLYIIGRVSEKNILYMLSPLVAVLFLIPAYIFWNIGVAHYKSTGS